MGGNALALGKPQAAFTVIERLDAIRAVQRTEASSALDHGKRPRRQAHLLSEAPRPPESPRYGNG